MRGNKFFKNRIRSFVVLCVGLLSLFSVQRSSLVQAAGGDLHASSSKTTDHVALSTPIVKAWRKLPVGVPVFTLDDLAATKGWLEQALIQRIDGQSGRWHIHIEAGYTVFRIYPYIAEGDPQPRVYQGIVLKVCGDLSVTELVTAIRERKSTVILDEYDLFGEGISEQKYSRPHS
jgi:hypothetical protein